MLPVVVHADLRACGFGRQRFNVLGAWNAVTRHLIAVTNTTVVNTETMSELLRKIAALGLTGAITLVFDNARCRRTAAVKALASQLGITLLFLPSNSPNLNLIERLSRFTKRRALYGRYDPKFANFHAAICTKWSGTCRLGGRSPCARKPSPCKRSLSTEPLRSVLRTRSAALPPAIAGFMGAALRYLDKKPISGLAISRISFRIFF